MDDWDQLTNLGDCGALCDMTILDLQPPHVLDILWDAAQATLDLLMDYMGMDRVTLDRLGASATPRSLRPPHQARTAPTAPAPSTP